MKIQINADLYDICGRLKEIDSGYFVMFDGKRKRFEVHHIGQKGNTLCVVLPYDRLDSRAVTHVRRTRAERLRQVIEEMERENAKADKSAKENAIKKEYKSLDRF